MLEHGFAKLIPEKLRDLLNMLFSNAALLMSIKVTGVIVGVSVARFLGVEVYSEYVEYIALVVLLGTTFGGVMTVVLPKLLKDTGGISGEVVGSGLAIAVFLAFILMIIEAEYALISFLGVFLIGIFSSSVGVLNYKGESGIIFRSAFFSMFIFSILFFLSLRQPLNIEYVIGLYFSPYLIFISYLLLWEIGFKKVNEFRLNVTSRHVASFFYLYIAACISPLGGYLIIAYLSKLPSAEDLAAYGSAMQVSVIFSQYFVVLNNAFIAKLPTISVLNGSQSMARFGFYLTVIPAIGFASIFIAFPSLAESIFGVGFKGFYSNGLMIWIMLALVLNSVKTMIFRSIIQHGVYRISVVSGFSWLLTLVLLVTIFGIESSVDAARIYFMSLLISTILMIPVFSYYRIILWSSVFKKENLSFFLSFSIFAALFLCIDTFSLMNRLLILIGFYMLIAVIFFSEIYYDKKM